MDPEDLWVYEQCSRGSTGWLFYRMLLRTKNVDSKNPIFKEICHEPIRISMECHKGTVNAAKTGSNLWRTLECEAEFSRIPN